MGLADLNFNEYGNDIKIENGNFTTESIYIDKTIEKRMKNGIRKLFFYNNRISKFLDGKRINDKDIEKKIKNKIINIMKKEYPNSVLDNVLCEVFLSKNGIMIFFYYININNKKIKLLKYNVKI